MFVMCENSLSDDSKKSRTVCVNMFRTPSLVWTKINTEKPCMDSHGTACETYVGCHLPNNPSHRLLNSTFTRFRTSRIARILPLINLLCRLVIS